LPSAFSLGTDPAAHAGRPATVGPIGWTGHLRGMFLPQIVTAWPMVR